MASTVARLSDINTPALKSEIAKRQAKIEAAIGYATRMRDWQALAVAIDEMIEFQKEFTAFWGDYVSVRHGMNRYNIENAEPGSLSVAEAQKVTGIAQQQVSRWSTRLADEAEYRSGLFDAAYCKAMAQGQRNQQSLSNEHYTPVMYIEAARTVLGVIDLDPASCAEANEVVRATEFFAPPITDGLKTDWHGRVWLNPPYGNTAGDFIDKLDAQRCVGNVSAAIVLVNAHCTDTKWFQKLWNSDALCFTNHRINFYGDDTRSGSTHGSAFAYFGPDLPAFIQEFSRFGPIVRKISA